MTQQHIYHLNELGQLEPMQEADFDLEDTLQELVAKHLDLLSGEQITPGVPRRWILIDREQGIPDIEGGSNRWALDHLLIDQDAIPTLVETKLAGNPDIRRAVVGQMLEYAAHARRTWNVERIRRVFEERARDDGLNPDEFLAELLQPEEDLDVESFWQQVEINLRAANLRLLFVADAIPDSLARVVEFLNEQMPNIRVLAVEIKQFRGATGRTLVPRVIGRTAEAGVSPSPDSPRRRSRMTRDDFFAQMPNAAVRQATQRLMDLTEKGGGSVVFGESSVSLRGNCPAWPKPLTVAWIYPVAGRGGWLSTQDFTFGMTSWDKDKQPPQVVEILERWAAQFENDPFSNKIFSKPIAAWWVSHADAADAANIDLLAERLERVLRELRDLPPNS